MTDWSLPTLFEGVHEKVHAELDLARRAVAHPTTKGDASEDVWLHLLNTYLPRRYRALERPHIDPCEVAIGRDVAVGQFVEQMAHACGHDH